MSTWTFDKALFGPALLEGVVLVAAVTVAYVALAPKPDPRTSMLGCGSLVRADDPAGVMIPLTSRSGGVPSIEVLDPLCPSCKAFDARLGASSLGERLALKGVLFPLDSTCNWMVTESIHPGACAVSEAVLCAAGVGSGQKSAADAGAVLQWAFAHQADLRALAARDEGALRVQLEREFPAHIVQFDAGKAELDPTARTLVEQAWSDQRGASFFFVVSRASPDGEEQYNEALSRDRAKAVLDHLDQKFQDEDLKKEVGLLWLGEEFAQLSEEFCGFDRSRSGSCSRADINRSAFVAWIDCAI